MLTSPVRGNIKEMQTDKETNLLPHKNMKFVFSPVTRSLLYVIADFGSSISLWHSFQDAKWWLHLQPSHSKEKVIRRKDGGPMLESKFLI